MTEKKLRNSRIIENMCPPDLTNKLLDRVCESVADAFLGQVEYGNDYIVSTEMAKEDWANGFGTKYTYTLTFDKLVHCHDCANASFDEFGSGWCCENCRGIKPWNFCCWGDGGDAE